MIRTSPGIYGGGGGQDGNVWTSLSLSTATKGQDNSISSVTGAAALQVTNGAAAAGDDDTGDVYSWDLSAVVSGAGKLRVRADMGGPMGDRCALMVGACADPSAIDGTAGKQRAGAGWKDTAAGDQEAWYLNATGVNSPTGDRSTERVVVTEITFDADGDAAQANYYYLDGSGNYTGLPTNPDTYTQLQGALTYAMVYVGRTGDAGAPQSQGCDVAYQWLPEPS